MGSLACKGVDNRNIRFAVTFFSHQIYKIALIWIEPHMIRRVPILEHGIVQLIMLNDIHMLSQVIIICFFFLR